MIRKRSVLFAWCFSYCALLLVMILMCVALGRSVQKQLVGEYKVITQTLQQQTSTAISEYYGSMTRSAYELCGNYLITNFAASSNPMGSNYHTLKPIQETLVTYGMQSGAITRYLYFDNIERALTADTIHTKDVLYEILCGGTDIDDAAFEEILRSYHFNDIRILNHADRRQVAMMTSIPLIGNRAHKGVLIQVLDTGALEKLMLANTALENSTTVLRDDAGKVICATGNTEVAGLLQDADLSQIKNSELFLDGAAYWCQQETLEGTDWTLVTVMPMSYIQEKSNANLRYAVPLAVVMVGAAAVLSLVLLYLNYRPLSRLSKQIAGGADPSGQNEYERLGHAFRGMQDHLARMQLLQDWQNEQLRQEFLTSCLENDLDISEEHLHTLLEHVGVHFAGEWFSVVLLELQEDMDEDGWPVLPGEKELLTQIAKQADVACDIQILARGRHTIALLNFSDETAAQRMCDAVARRQHDDAAAHPGGLLFTCGRPVRGFGSIRLAYLDACEQESYQNAQTALLEHADADGPDKHDVAAPRFAAEQEDLLMRYILAGSGTQALGVMEFIARHNLRDEHLSLTLCRSLADDILCGIAKSLAAQPAVWHSQQPELERDMRAVRGDKTREALAEHLFEAVRRSARACESFNRENALLKGQPVEKIMRCVEEHFKESDFNVTKAAEYLGMNVTYLSKLFKTHTGIGLLNYISGLRVNYAKECIVQRHMSVTQAARAAGFDNANTFIRIFKRYEGVTPGKIGDEK